MKAYVVTTSVFEDSYKFNLSRHTLYRDLSEAEKVLLEDMNNAVKEWEDVDDLDFSQEDGMWAFRCEDTYIGGMICEVELKGEGDIAYLLWGYYWEYGAWNGEAYAANTDEEALMKEMRQRYDENKARYSRWWEDTYLGSDSTHLETKDNEQYVQYITRVTVK